MTFEDYAIANGLRESQDYSYESLHSTWDAAVAHALHRADVITLRNALEHIAATCNGRAAEIARTALGIEDE